MPQQTVDPFAQFVKPPQTTQGPTVDPFSTYDRNQQSTTSAPPQPSWWNSPIGQMIAPAVNDIKSIPGGMWDMATQVVPAMARFASGSATPQDMQTGFNAAKGFVDPVLQMGSQVMRSPALQSAILGGLSQGANAPAQMAINIGAVQPDVAAPFLGQMARVPAQYATGEVIGAVGKPVARVVRDTIAPAIAEFPIKPSKSVRKKFADVNVGQGIVQQGVPLTDANITNRLDTLEGQLQQRLAEHRNVNTVSDPSRMLPAAPATVPSTIDLPMSDWSVLQNDLTSPNAQMIPNRPLVNKLFYDGEVPGVNADRWLSPSRADRALDLPPFAGRQGLGDMPGAPPADWQNVGGTLRVDIPAQYETGNPATAYDATVSPYEIDRGARSYVSNQLDMPHQTMDFSPKLDEASAQYFNKNPNAMDLPFGVRQKRAAGFNAKNWTDTESNVGKLYNEGVAVQWRDSIGNRVPQTRDILGQEQQMLGAEAFKADADARASTWARTPHLRSAGLFAAGLGGDAWMSHYGLPGGTSLAIGAGAAALNTFLHSPLAMSSTAIGIDRLANSILGNGGLSRTMFHTALSEGRNNQNQNK